MKSNKFEIYMLKENIEQEKSSDRGFQTHCDWFNKC